MSIPAEVQEAVRAATLEVSDLSELSHERLSAVLEQENFAVIRGLISPEVVEKGVASFRSQYDPDADNPATGESPDQIMGIYQKLSIGGAEHSGVYRPRCMRTFYNPFWTEDRFELHDAFRTLARVRNILYGFPLDYAIDQVENGFWSAVRIHHYPAGGGFLVSHLDNIVPTVQSKDGLSNQYFQPVLMMSKKGVAPDCDFQTGGGFFVVRGQRYFYEEDCELGDIVVYSGRTEHGVADIDLHKTFDTRRSDGRLAGFVTLYREFTRKGQLEEYVGKPEQPVVQ